MKTTLLAELNKWILLYCHFTKCTVSLYHVDRLSFVWPIINVRFKFYIHLKHISSLLFDNKYGFKAALQAKSDSFVLFKNNSYQKNKIIMNSLDFLPFFRQLTEMVIM